ncbi:hypothetical protein PaG_00573 [Moesziomyces aphidis]|uniref:Uncharacterized protein n=1 Tax=Moesziomyces aphidis TaxID=84754 RepID=W3VUC9_MOEAP|nr:hypothetical protein PaG_00573 [Moesziomyces aphidis]
MSRSELESAKRNEGGGGQAAAMQQRSSVLWSRRSPGKDKVESLWADDAVDAAARAARAALDGSLVVARPCPPRLDAVCARGAMNPTSKAEHVAGAPAHNRSTAGRQPEGAAAGRKAKRPGESRQPRMHAHMSGSSATLWTPTRADVLHAHQGFLHVYAVSFWQRARVHRRSKGQAQLKRGERAPADHCTAAAAASPSLPSVSSSPSSSSSPLTDLEEAASHPGGPASQLGHSSRCVE